MPTLQPTKLQTPPKRNQRKRTTTTTNRREENPIRPGEMHRRDARAIVILIITILLLLMTGPRRPTRTSRRDPTATTRTKRKRKTRRMRMRIVTQMEEKRRTRIRMRVRTKRTTIREAKMGKTQTRATTKLHKRTPIMPGRPFSRRRMPGSFRCRPFSPRRPSLRTTESQFLILLLPLPLHHPRYRVWRNRSLPNRNRRPKRKRQQLLPMRRRLLRARQESILHLLSLRRIRRPRLLRNHLVLRRMSIPARLQLRLSNHHSNPRHETCRSLLPYHSPTTILPRDTSLFTFRFLTSSWDPVAKCWYNPPEASPSRLSFRRTFPPEQFFPSRFHRCRCT